MKSYLGPSHKFTSIGAEPNILITAGPSEQLSVGSLESLNLFSSTSINLASNSITTESTNLIQNMYVSRSLTSDSAGFINLNATGLSLTLLGTLTTATINSTEQLTLTASSINLETNSINTSSTNLIPNMYVSRSSYADSLNIGASGLSLTLYGTLATNNISSTGPLTVNTSSINTTSINLTGSLVSTQISSSVSQNITITTAQFWSSGQIYVSEPMVPTSLNIVVIGGGGGGGYGVFQPYDDEPFWITNAYGGGGGGGGQFLQTSVPLTQAPNQAYSIVIGAGGGPLSSVATGDSYSSSNGSNSNFLRYPGDTALQAIGGGAGATVPYWYLSANGVSGSSGGGAAGYPGISCQPGLGLAGHMGGYNSYTTGTGTTGSYIGYNVGGGGGGSGSLGQSTTQNNTGLFYTAQTFGGSGTACAISGSMIEYCAGGGGGGVCSFQDGTNIQQIFVPVFQNANYGAGVGGYSIGNISALNAFIYGSGGGGGCGGFGGAAGSLNLVPGNGCQGAVFVSYVSDPPGAILALGGDTIYSYGNVTVHTFINNGTFVLNNISQIYGPLASTYFVSTVGSGTQPLFIESSTVVPVLYVARSTTTDSLNLGATGHDLLLSSTLTSSVSTGVAPFSVNSSTLVPVLYVARSQQADTINFGSSIGASLFSSTINSGTAPLKVVSSTVVPVLYVARSQVSDTSNSLSAGSTGFSVSITGSLGLSNQLVSTINSGTAPFSVTSSTVVPVLYVARSQQADSLTGSSTISAPIFISTIGSGTAPFSVSSSTIVPTLYVARSQLSDTSNSLSSGASCGSIILQGSIINFNYLIIAGGGGGAWTGGGGGAGGLLQGSSTFSSSSNIFNISVGLGGTTNVLLGGSGLNSSITGPGFNLTAIGGGGGGGIGAGSSGGSGGGGGNGSGGSGTAGQGFAGGNCTTGSSAGGGGGFTTAGNGSNISNIGGVGGTGTASSISGSSVLYCGGGAGYSNTSPVAAGGPGGGGSGGNNSAYGQNATSYGSGGGGGGEGSFQQGGNGSNGLVIIAYTSGAPIASGGSISVFNNQIIHTFTSSGQLFIANLITGSSIIAGSLTLSNTTDSTSTATGSMVLSGGLSVQKSLTIGSTLVSNYASILNNLNVAGSLLETNVIDSSNTATGSMILSGGLSVQKSMWVGSTLTATNVTVNQFLTLPPVLSTLNTQAKKSITIANTTWQTLFTYSGSGIINKFWFAMNTNSSNVFINMAYDGSAVPQFGSNKSSPSEFDGSSISLLDIVGTGSAVNVPYFFDNIGLTNFSTGGNGTLGGYFSIPAPFSSSFTIQVYNGTGATITMWAQVYYTIQPVASPLRLYGYGFDITGLSYPNEYYWLSQRSANGVYLAAHKFFMNNNSNGTYTFEGRFKFYSSTVAGSTVGLSINQNHWTSTSGSTAYQTPTGYTTSSTAATVLSWSSGTADYFLGSYDWATVNVGGTTGSFITSMNKYGGIITDTSNNGNWTVYRFYDNNQGFIGVGPNTYLTATWSCGDIVTGTAGSLNLYGAFVAYYA